MEIEDVKVDQEQEKVAKRLAVLKKCLCANEKVECKPIQTNFRQEIINNQKTMTEQAQNQTEIFLTNLRILIIIYYVDQSNKFDEKSIFFNDSSDFKIYVPAKYPNINTIQYQLAEVQQNVNLFISKLEEEERKHIEDFWKKHKNLYSENNSNENIEKINEKNSVQQINKEEVIKKKILEKDPKLRQLYEQVVEKKKILTEDQFWLGHDGYQNYLKFKSRDEEKIKRDYIQNEIPLINAVVPFDISVESLDEKQTRYDQFQQKIYDPNNLIENQNLKSFQNYKQDIFFAGKIDSIVSNLEKIYPGRNIHKVEMGEDLHSHNHNHHIELLEEELVLHGVHQNKKNNSEEISKRELAMLQHQSPQPENQRKLEEFLKQISNKDPLEATKQQFTQFKEKTPEQSNKAKDGFKNAFYCILNQNNMNTTDPDIQRYNEEYSDKFYQMREILRWLYKEKSKGEKSRPEILEKLKTELEFIRNSISDLPTYQKEGNKNPQKKRLLELTKSFIFN